MVEVDSTYYRLPAREMVERWAERTPEGFVMHVKAFGVMTRHPVKIDQLPPDLRDEAPADERGRLERPSREFRAEIFSRFLEALEPLRSAGKLGGLLFQFPPYVVPKEASYDYLVLGARAGRRRPDARRVPAPRLVRGGSARGDASLPRGARHGARRRRRAEDGRQERPADRARADRSVPLRAATRSQRRARGTCAEEAPRSGSTTSTPKRS